MIFESDLITKSAIILSVGHSATAFRNFAIRQLFIPQNDIWQRDQNAKTFGKKCLAINKSENRHSETFIRKITIWRKNIQKINILQFVIAQIIFGKIVIRKLAVWKNIFGNSHSNNL